MVNTEKTEKVLHSHLEMFSYVQQKNPGETINIKLPEERAVVLRRKGRDSFRILDPETQEEERVYYKDIAIVKD